MKKIFMSLLAVIGMTMSLSATSFEFPEIDPLIKECTLNPLASECHPTLLKGDKGDKGDTGLTGATGATGADGQDFNSKRYEAAYVELLAYAKKATNYYEDLAAMSAAGDAADLGEVIEGQTQIAGGFGYSSSWSGNSQAAALKLKHGLSNDTTFVIAVSGADSNAYNAGLGFTYKF